MNTYPTLVDKIYDLKETLPNEIFLRQPYGDTWKELTYSEAITEALRLVSAMKSSGLKKGDKVGIFSKNCYHWVISEIAIMLGGFITIPFYANLGEDALKEVIELSGINFLFVGKLDNWEKVKNGIPEDMPIVSFQHYKGSAVIDSGIKWDDFIKDKEPYNENFRPKPDDIWAIFYTSGTTGVPKGVVMTYEAPANLINKQDKQYNNFNFSAPGRNTFLSYMPLNHIAEQTLIITCGFYYGGQISFVESLYTFAKNLADAKPSIFLGVPGIWDKLMQGILKQTPKLEVMLKMPKIAEEVKKKIRTAIGLNNTKLVISGASAMPPSTVEWFQKIGINIQETYGMTEALAIVIIQPRDDIRIGKSGKCFEEGQIKIDPDTKEILVKNSWMFKEYYNEPELTELSYTKDGFYKTGDTGEIDLDGYLSVKGRVKDTFKTTKGLFIVPAPIENRFAANALIDQICVVGIDLPQPIGLIQLSQQSRELNADEIKKSLLETLNSVNKQLKLNEKLNKLVVISENWTVENGFLTPTNKIKRNVIHETYNSSYKEWYQQKNKFILA
ncbi:MAG: AMP-binding protein [Bacteroidota bacterium]